MRELTYLYVEDDSLSQEIMQMILLRGMGVPAERLHIFSDSYDFMARVKALVPQPDVILLDVHVSPLDGFSMLQQLRAESDYQNARVIALTASVMNEEVAQLRQSGFNGAIAKPLSFSTFPALIERIANGETVWHIA